jgi:hypothetical protein
MSRLTAVGWLAAIVAILLLVALGFTLIRFYGLH